MDTAKPCSAPRRSPLQHRHILASNLVPNVSRYEATDGETRRPVACELDAASERVKK